MARGLALLLCAAPLFIGLDLWDLRNDESIYSYSVDRILDTGDWLTPRSIPGDNPFLEKPPLKFWIVAGAMRAGITPRSERGMRTFDALFGCLAFGYVFAIARRAAGPIAGFVAVFLLFTLSPILYEHGLRSNNMEGPLILAYCGGMYHFLRWVERDRGTGRAHAYALAAYFVLGFMTKFVAALFLPFAAALAFAWQPRSAAKVRDRWSEWIGPSVVAAVMILPWFLYQWRTNGDFWAILFGHHVYERFTKFLDPTHLHPWHYYFSQAWQEYGWAGSLTITVLGIAPIVWHARTGRPWLARLLLVWWLAPLAMISIGTSKLFHYAYPFLPPLAIGAGWLSALVIGVVWTRLAPAVNRWADDTSVAKYVASRRGLTLALGGLAVLAAIMALLTYLRGEPVTVTLGGVRVFRNSSVLRPIVIAAILLAITSRGAVAVRIGGALLLLSLMPIDGYAVQYVRLSSVDRPLRATSDCLRSQLRAGVAKRAGIYVGNPQNVGHPYSYYFRPIGPWEDDPERLVDEARVRLFEPGQETPMVMSLDQLASVRRALGPQQPAAALDATRDPAGLGTPAVLGFETEPGVVMLLPGPYRVCLGPAVEAGGQLLRAQRPNAQ